MGWKLRRSLYAAASHQLPGHPGACANLHGHTYGITVEVTSEAIGEDGMVVDFGKIVRAVDGLDHSHLNDTLQQPTSELLAQWVAHQVWSIAPHVLGISVEVSEAPWSSVTYRTTSADLRREETRRSVMDADCRGAS